MTEKKEAKEEADRLLEYVSKYVTHFWEEPEDEGN